MKANAQQYIDKISQLTEQGKLNWARLAAVSFIASMNKSTFEGYRNDLMSRMGLDDHNLIDMDSYFTTYGEGVIYFFTLSDIFSSNKPMIIVAQSKMTAKMSALNATIEYQDTLKKLLRVIENRVDQSDAFLDSLLSE